MKKTAVVMLLIAVVLVWAQLSFAKDDDYDAAVRFYLKKDFRQAVQHFRSYLSRRPDPAAYYLLGYAYYKLRNYDEAVWCFDEAYLIDPGISPKVERLLIRGH